MVARRVALTALTAVHRHASLTVVHRRRRRREDLREELLSCHGKEGEPNAVFAKQGVRSFKDQAWQKATPDAQIEKSIREGRKGTMMASFDKQFSAEELKGLVAYIRKLGK